MWKMLKWNRCKITINIIHDDLERFSLPRSACRDLAKARNPSGLLVVKLGDIQFLGGEVPKTEPLKGG